MRLSSLVVVVSTSLVLSACGKEDSSTKSQGKAAGAKQSPDSKAADNAPGKAAAAAPAAAVKDDLSAEAACALLTAEEAAAALGEGTQPGESGAVGCTWNASAGGVKFVALGLRDSAMWDQAKKISQDMAKQAGKTFEELPGLGEDAFFLDVVGLQVIIKAGKRYGELGMVGPEDAAAKQRLLELAKKVAAKL